MPQAHPQHLNISTSQHLNISTSDLISRKISGKNRSKDSPECKIERIRYILLRVCVSCRWYRASLNNLPKRDRKYLLRKTTYIRNGFLFERCVEIIFEDLHNAIKFNAMPFSMWNVADLNIVDLVFLNLLQSTSRGTYCFPDFASPIQAPCNKCQPFRDGDWRDEKLFIVNAFSVPLNRFDKAKVRSHTRGSSLSIARGGVEIHCQTFASNIQLHC
jgi:hypothetical protein